MGHRSAICNLQSAIWAGRSPGQITVAEAAAQPKPPTRVPTPALVPPHAPRRPRRRAARARPSGRGRRGGLYTQGQGAVPRRAHRPLSDRWHLVFSGRPARPGARPGLRAPRLARRLDPRSPSPTPGTPPTSPTRASAAASAGTAPTSRAPVRPHHELGGALRVGQLPRDASISTAARSARTRAPTCRSRCRRRTAHAGCQPPGGARRQPPLGDRPAAAVDQTTARPAAAGGTTAASCARSTCARSTAWTSRISSPGRACRAAACAATVVFRATLHNVDKHKQRVIFHASVGGQAGHFPAVTIPGTAAAASRPR